MIGRMPNLIRLRRVSSRGAGDDAGVIAIIVALSISTFLLGFAALAVDLGSAYTAKAQLQSIANRLALAGAGGLPSSADALSRINDTLTQACRESPMPDICTTAGAVAGTGWETDGRTDNGEIQFFSDANGDGKFSLTGDLVRNPAGVTVTAVKVVLPPSTVQFGLAAAIGVSSTRIHKSATGEVVTALGSGVLPFALTQTDLNAGQFCAHDTSANNFATFPGSTPGLPVTLHIDDPDPATVPNGQAGLTAQVTLTVHSGSPQLSQVQFHFSNSPDPITATQQGTTLTWKVTLPAGEPGASAQLWATGQQGGSGPGGPGGPGGPPGGPGGPGPRFTTNFELVSYTGVPAQGDGLCDQPEATSRGFIQLARPGGGNPLPQNVRSGPVVNLYPDPDPDGGLLGSVGAAQNCAATIVLPATTCVRTQTGTSFSGDLTAGLLTRSGNLPGRLIGNCGSGTTGMFGVGGVDNSHLFSDPGFLDLTPPHDGTSSTLLKRITAQSGSPAAGPDDRGWITSKALKCPWMAVMPVVDGSGRIQSLRYVWIDDAAGDHGLDGTPSRITSIRGYIIDPGYLPSLVSGSKVVGPYLSADMPKEALLIPDLGGPTS